MFTKTMVRTLSALHANVYRLFGGAGPFNRNIRVARRLWSEIGRFRNVLPPFGMNPCIAGGSHGGATEVSDLELPRQGKAHAAR